MPRISTILRGAARPLAIVAALPLAACIVDDDPTLASDEADVENPTAPAPAALLPVVQVYSTQYSCSGTLIAPNKVLTAAHCFCGDTNPLHCVTSPLDVNFRPNPHVTTQIPNPHHGTALVHPSYTVDLQSLEDDLAIITLDAPVYIPPLAIATSNPASGTPLSVAGYGDTGADCTGPSGTLGYQGALVGGYENSNKIMFTNDDSTLCHGDSGGPAMDAAQSQVDAVNSGTWWTFTHGSVDKYTATAPYRAWLQANVCTSPCDGNGPLCRCAETPWVQLASSFVGSTGNLYIANHVGGGEFCNAATDGATISRTSKDTAQTPSVLFKATDCVHDFVEIARDGTYAVVLDAGRRMVSRIPLAGGVLVDLAPTAALATAGTHLVVDASVSPSRVYWADAGGLKAVSMTGGAVTTLVAFPAGFTTQAIGVDATYAYYTADVAIRRVAKAGGAPVDWVATNHADTLHVYGNDQIAWTEHAVFRIRQKVGSLVTELYAAEGNRVASSVVYDGTFVYVLDFASSGTDYHLDRIHPAVRILERVPTTGNVLGAHHLEIDATRAWWVDVGGIKKTAK